MKLTKLIIACLLFTISFQQICTTSQYFNGQRCAPCKANCICSSQYGCDSCMSGYTYDSKFQNCLQCPTATSATNVGCAECCSQIVATQFVCSSCPALSSTYLLGGQCIRIQGCISMSGSGLCTACGDGFYLRDGTCVTCHASCATCSDSTYCNTCKTGYFNATNADYRTCVSCSTGCISCTSASSCTTCATRYRLSASACVACSANCLQCTNSACTNCEDGYGLISGVCQICSNVAFGGTAGCQTCTVSVGLISCTKCSAGYYLTALGACQTCSSRFPNAALCTSNVALQCQNDYSATLSSRYYLMSGQCIANTNRCKVMSSVYGTCSSCYFESGAYYTLVNGVCNQCSQVGCATYSTSCQCLSCQNGYQYVNRQCVNCQNLNCFVCQNNVRSCQVCAPYYGLISSACIRCTQAACLNCDGDSAKCVKCQTGYYNSNGICYRCQSFCQSCTSATVCTVCQPGNYLLSSGRCKSLPTNCLLVDSSGLCTKCVYGYQISSGMCVPCSASFFNLGQCQRYCPNYYAQLQWASNLATLLFILTGTLFAVAYF